MPSITVRNLDEDTKQALRERAARNGRSMEEEARVMLAAAEGQSIPPLTTKSPLTSSDDAYSIADHRILLIIGGGIAAYKCLELIRRLKERVIAVRVVMTKAAQEFITPLIRGSAFPRQGA